MRAERSNLMEIVPFDIVFFDAMDLRSWDQMGIDCQENVRERIANYAANGPAYTVLIDNEVMACGGVYIHWQGVGEAWVLTSPLVEKHMVSFHKAVKTKLQEIARDHNLHRIQCVVNQIYRRSQKWVERLGFEREGLLKYYGPDRTSYYMYARTKWHH